MSTKEFSEMPAAFRARLDAALLRPSMLDPLAVESVRAAAGFAPQSDAVMGYMIEGDVAIVDVRGPLAQRAWSCWMLSGDGYDAIAERVGAALADEAVGSIVLRIDSPGGEVAGCFEAMRAIRASAAKVGKPMVAFADELCASAAYAIACACDAIVTPDTGIVGSVGVITVVEDRVKANEALGRNVRVIRSGRLKATPHPDEPLVDETIARVQGDIDALAQIFASEVATARDMSTEKVLSLEGATLLGADAVKAGLADYVGTLHDAVRRSRILRYAPRTTTIKRGASAAHQEGHMSEKKASKDLDNAPARSAEPAPISRDIEVKVLENKLRETELAHAREIGMRENAERERDAAASALANVEAERDALASSIEQEHIAADGLRAQLDAAERRALLADARAAGKLSPAHLDPTTPSGAFLSTLSTTQLRGYLETKGREIPRIDVRAPAHSLHAKKWSEMSPSERARLYQDDRATYDALKAAAGQ